MVILLSIKENNHALRDKDCPLLINCTTQEYLVNVGQDSHFNMSYNRGGDLPNT